MDDRVCAQVQHSKGPGDMHTFASRWSAIKVPEPLRDCRNGRFFPPAFTDNLDIVISIPVLFSLPLMTHHILSRSPGNDFQQTLVVNSSMGLILMHICGNNVAFSGWKYQGWRFNPEPCAVERPRPCGVSTDHRTGLWSNSSRPDLT